MAGARHDNRCREGMTEGPKAAAEERESGQRRRGLDWTGLVDWTGIGREGSSSRNPGRRPRVVVVEVVVGR
jgi:hypothetical protein